MADVIVKQIARIIKERFSKEKIKSFIKTRVIFLTVSFYVIDYTSFFLSIIERI